MSISSRTFQSAGQISQHLIPGAYSRIDSIKGQGSTVSVNNGVIMGRCTGGEPQTLLKLASVSEVVNTLKSGPLMEAVRQAFNPGDDYVPQYIYAMRVNDADPSSYTLENSSNDMITLTSRDYGLHTNQITVKIETATSNGKKITIGYKTNTEEFDDVYRKSLTITHATATGTVTITSAVQTLVLSVGTITIDLNSYPTIGELAAYINAQSGYSAVVEAGQEDKSSLELDGTSAVSLTSGAIFQSTMQAIIDKLNNDSNYVTATAVNATNNRSIPDNITTAVYFIGGSEGSYTSTEWSSALTLLEAENIQFISTPDSSNTVHAAIKTHCASMSSVTGRKERQFLVGNAWGTTVSGAVTESKSLNSKWGLKAYNGYKQYDVNGDLQEYDASYTSCLLLGIACATAINEPLTFKKLNVISLEKKLSTSDLETLIANGVCPVAYNSSGLAHIVRQVNTYQTDDLKWNEFSVVKEMGFVSRDLRNYLENMFIGKAGSSLYGGVMRGAVEARLAYYTDLGVFSKDSDGTAWWNVTISISGDKVAVDYDAYPTLPINFIFITNHFHELVTTG